MIRRFITQNLRLFFLFVLVMPMLLMAQPSITINSSLSDTNGKIKVGLGYNGDQDYLKYYLEYLNEKGEVTETITDQYDGSILMDKRPATLTVEVHWHDSENSDITIATEVATYYGLASSALTAPFQYDGTVNAPKIIPALPADATKVYASSAAEAAPTNSIDRNTGVITITGVTSPNKDTYAAYFDMPAAAAGPTGILNIRSNFGYELGQFSLTVTQKPLTEDMISISPASITYDDGTHTPWVEVKDGIYSFNKDYDYTVSYANEIKNVGDYPVTVTATANGKLSGGPFTKTFSITARSIENAQVTLGYNTAQYTGSELKPTVSVALPGEKGGYDPPIGASNYDVSYIDATNVGTATVKVTGKGNYTGTAKAQFTITAKDLSGAKFSDIPNQTYTGNEIKPEPTVTLVSATNASTTTLVKGTDFDFSYARNVNVPVTPNATVSRCPTARMFRPQP